VHTTDLQTRISSTFAVGEREKGNGNNQDVRGSSEALAMFSLFREPPLRRKFREEFEELTALIRRSDLALRMVVAHSIHTANAAFQKSFASLEAFQVLPMSRQMDYVQKLSAMERELHAVEPAAAMGFGLFKMYVGALTEGDTQLANQFAKELDELSAPSE
jgi:hypothetical protein